MEKAQVNYEKTADLLRQAWEDAANHKKLTFEQTNALRIAFETFDKTVQSGENLQILLDETETY